MVDSLTSVEYDGPNVLRCADFLVSSYTPTLSALLRAQSGTQSDLKVDTLSLALVGEKGASGSLTSPPAIPGVEDEPKIVDAICVSSNVQVFNNSPSGSSVTHAEEAIKAGNIVHLACHGVQDVTDATQSGFLPGDGRLHISNLMGI